MSTKKQNRKRKQKGEFENIEDLAVPTKKMLLDSAPQQASKDVKDAKNTKPRKDYRNSSQAMSIEHPVNSAAQQQSTKQPEAKKFYKSSTENIFSAANNGHKFSKNSQTPNRPNKKAQKSEDKAPNQQPLNAKQQKSLTLSQITPLVRELWGTDKTKEEKREVV